MVMAPPIFMNHEFAGFHEQMPGFGFSISQLVTSAGIGSKIKASRNEP